MSPSKLPYIAVRMDQGLKDEFEAAARKQRMAVSQWLLQLGIEEIERKGRELPDPPPKPKEPEK